MLGVVASSLTIFELDPRIPNMSEHIATRWPSARKMLRPTMLRYIALVSCDRLAGALGWAAFLISSRLNLAVIIVWL